MSGVSWGSRQVATVLAAGLVTQIFPVDVPTTVSTVAYPPVGGGLVKRAIQGYIDDIAIESDAVNSGYVEIWDVSGLDRGAAKNANDSVLLTDTYVQANGKLIAIIQIKPAAGAGHPFGSYINMIPFSKGIGIRFVGTGGYVNISPVIEGGFMVQYIAG